MNHNHYSLTSLKQPGKYLKNCFFNIGFQIFRQVIGIPMGSDSVVLFFANQFVLHHESECVCKMKLVRKFKSKGLGIYLAIGFDTITLTPLEKSFQNCKFDGNGLTIYNILPLFGY